jgi:hypothetical protein
MSRWDEANGQSDPVVSGSHDFGKEHLPWMNQLGSGSNTDWALMMFTPVIATNYNSEVFVRPAFSIMGNCCAKTPQRRFLTRVEFAPLCPDALHNRED